jgi:hypothetical protein
MEMLASVARETALGFWRGILGLFVLVAMFALVLVAIAFGAASGLFLLVALYEAIRWYATGDAAMGGRALAFGLYAAVCFAVAPALHSGVAEVREWPERRRRAAMERVALLRLAAPMQR